MREQCNRYELPCRIEWVRGVDGTSITHDWLASRGYAVYSGWKVVRPDLKAGDTFYRDHGANVWWENEIPTGSFGSLLSHLSIWEQIVEQHLELSLILEDDVIFTSDPTVTSPLEEIERALAPGDRPDRQCDLLLLGRLPLRRNEERVSPNLVRPGYFYGCYAYALTLTGAEKLVASRPSAHLMASDEYLSAMIGDHPRKDVTELVSGCRKLDALAFEPRIALHRDPATTGTDIGYWQQDSQGETVLAVSGRDPRRWGRATREALQQMMTWTRAATRETTDVGTTPGGDRAEMFRWRGKRARGRRAPSTRLAGARHGGSITDEMLSIESIREILLARSSSPRIERCLPVGRGSPRDEDEVFREYVCVQIEMAVEEEVAASIRNRQAAIPGLKTTGAGLVAYWGGEPAPGCRDYCLQARNLAIRQSSRCDLDCSFCYYHGQEPVRPIPPGLFGIGDGYYDLETLRVMVERQALGSRGIAWVYFEPLCEVEKLYPALELFRDAGAYQYLYTNGLLATEDVLRRLADAGLNELRFNLAASDCSDRVLEAMANASRHIEHLCVESPMYRAYADRFHEKRKDILSTGVRYLNCAELQITPAAHRSGLWADEGPVYRHKRALVSPVLSRHLTYDLFALAAEEGWRDITLLDCSNDAKLFRDIRPDGEFRHYGVTPLPLDFYLDALDRYDLEGRIRGY